MLRWMTMQHQNTAIQMLCMLSHVIINHAADERISLEELHEKIMPETGYQLLHNYTDQIQNWSLICKVHSQASISSTSHMFRLKRELKSDSQATNIWLISCG
ncbi:DNA mismatch repair protein MLH3-like isoform X3 [Solanum lycopersicum]|uniref:DNA mismatch repair protein MLH3-like isoform X3 n=1 Tax=Solanum lycopersicum TaxID=4081 RepID=UPI0037491C6F